MIRRSSLAVVLFVLSSAPGFVPSACADWTATGQFLYRDREQDLNGFTGVEPDRPARHVDVQIVDATTSTVLASGATDGAGFYSILVPDNQTRTVRARMVSLSAQTPGLLIDVRNNQTARLPYTVNGSAMAGHAPTSNQNFGAVTALPEQGGEAFNVFDVAFLASEFFAALEGTGWPAIRVTIFWEPGTQDGTFFRPNDNSVHLRGGKGYDDTVIGHEHGHFLARNYSRDLSPGGTHFIGDNYQDLRLSWSEGYATFMAAAERLGLGLQPGPSYYIDTDGSPGPGNLNFAYEFESPSVPARGAGSEVAVTAALFDIIDDASTPDDTPGVDDDLLDRPISEFWEVFRNYLTQPMAVNVSLEDFWDGWFRPSMNHGFLPEMQGAFAAHDIRYLPDASENDNSFATAATAKATGKPLSKTFYPSGDADFLKWSAVAGSSYIVETTDIISDGNTTLTVYAPDQSTVLASNSDRSASDVSSRVSFLATESGWHYARVDHQADVGVYGSYSFRVLGSGGFSSTTFSEVAAFEGVALAASSRGVGWGDVDGDGRPELFVTRVGGGTLALYRNSGAGFLNKAVPWGAAVNGELEGGAFCDYDKDGDLDLFLTMIGPCVLLRNPRAGSSDTVFVDVTAAAGLARSFDGRSASWADADRDGWADLFVTDAAGQPALFRNNGNGTFTDVAASTGMAGGGASISAAWCDYDRDGDDDLYVTMNGSHSRLYQNRLRQTGSLGFVDVTAEAGVPAGVSGFACEWADFDADGWFDLYVTDGGGPNSLYRNQRDGTFLDVTQERNVASSMTTTTLAWGDYDNDGDVDLFAGNLNQTGLPGFNILSENVGGQFTTSTQLGAAQPIRAAAWADYDLDGDLDLYLSLANGVPNQLQKNNTTGANGLSVSLLGRTSNRDGYGAVVRARVPGRPMQVRQVSGGSGFGSQHSAAVEFGLGAATSADSVVVDWPSGLRTVLTGVSAGFHVVDEAGAVDVPPTPPGEAFALLFAGASPNPMRGGRGGALSFTVPGSAAGPALPTRLSLYAVSGRRVRTLMEKSLPPGPKQLAFEAVDERGAALAPGVYLLELTVPEGRATRKVVLLP